jgi:hypothetical protein
MENRDSYRAMASKNDYHAPFSNEAKLSQVGLSKVHPDPGFGTPASDVGIGIPAYVLTAATARH